MQIRQRIYRAAQSLFMEDAYIARVYYESMRDNFEGYDVTNDIAGFERLRGDFELLAPGGKREPTLGELFRIELALLRHLPDSAVESRFWSIDDRFRRVVPQSVSDSYDRRIPPLGDGKWSKIDFVRSQSRTLLDVIHANYLINLGREQSTKRLMFIIAMASLLILALAGVLAATAQGNLARQGLVLFAVAGMFGAIISIVNRLQKATARDAMAQDGIFELIGLRTGWVSILMSVTIGGVFSLVLYALVMGGLVDLAVPDLDLSPDPDGAKPTADTELGGTAGGEAQAGADGDEPVVSSADDAAGASLQPDQPPESDQPLPDAPPADEVIGGNGTASTATDNSGGVSDAAAKSGISYNPLLAGQCSAMTPAGNTWIDDVASALHFCSRVDFYKMVVWAFAAGFAERFVPDILNRLSKQQKL